MYNNLVNEIVKKGYKTEEIAHILANLLNCSEEIIENKLKQRKYSPLGDLVKDFSDNQIITFEEICEADAFLYIKSLTHSIQSDEFYIKRWCLCVFLFNR